MRLPAVVLSLAAVTSSAWAISAGRAKVCDVRDFGARGDGVVLDTDAIQRAIDACAANPGGGTVELSVGRFLSGPLSLRSHVRLDVEGGSTLLAKDAISNTVSERADKAFLTAYGQEGVEITGGGVIDGSDYPAQREEKTFPAAVEFSEVRGGRIEGLEFKNVGPLLIRSSQNVEVRNVRVESPSSEGREAVRISESHQVRVDHLTTSVGRAGLVVSDLEAGRSNGKPHQATELTLTDCTFMHGDGLVIGDGVENVRAERSRFVGASHGIFLQAGVAPVRNVTFSGVQMFGVKEPIHLLAISSATLTQISIADLKAVGATFAGRIGADPGSSVSGISLHNVAIEAEKGLQVENAQGSFEAVTVNAKEGPSVMITPSASIERN